MLGAPGGRGKAKLRPAMMLLQNAQKLVVSTPQKANKASRLKQKEKYTVEKKNKRRFILFNFQ